ncbi:MAG: hypothetical protein IH936_12820 [Acidobacteria bacterium]|nr:hypothetical protein [Acidobacteriota bacterium]
MRILITVGRSLFTDSRCWKGMEDVPGWDERELKQMAAYRIGSAKAWIQVGAARLAALCQPLNVTGNSKERIEGLERLLEDYENAVTLAGEHADALANAWGQTNRYRLPAELDTLHRFLAKKKGLGTLKDYDILLLYSPGTHGVANLLKAVLHALGFDKVEARGWGWSPDAPENFGGQADSLESLFTSDSVGIVSGGYKAAVIQVARAAHAKGCTIYYSHESRKSELAEIGPNIASRVLNPSPGGAPDLGS